MKLRRDKQDKMMTKINFKNIETLRAPLKNIKIECDALFNRII